MPDVKYRFYEPKPEIKYRFYGVDIDTPLSLAHNTPQFANSVIGRLNKKSRGSIYIDEILGRSLDAEFGWRVVDAYYSQEDSLITYFRAYGLDGEYMAGATYGIHFNDMSHRIGGAFKFKPQHGNYYYIPVESKFPTTDTGGYSVQVLCLDFPSETLNFGMNVHGKQHQNLIVTFRLFALAEYYPNDLDLKLR